MKLIRACCGLFSLITLLGLVVSKAHAQYVYTSIDDPLAIASSGYGTYVEGISGKIVVGYYFDNAGRHGFYHTLGTTSYTTLDDPAGFKNGSSGTGAYGISGNNIVGYYSDEINFSGTYGFVYNMVTSNYTALDDPAGVTEGTSSTEAFGISGTSVVGTIVGQGNTVSFLATASPGYSYASFYNPTPSRITSESGGLYATNYNTIAYGISGTNIVGFWTDVNGYANSYVYSTGNSVYTPISSPADGFCQVHGIDGNNVVGFAGDPDYGYSDSGFVFNLVTSNYTTVRDPSAAANTFAQGISGTSVVGYYTDSSSVTHGFVATIPVPVLLINTMGTNVVLTATNGIPTKSCFILETTNLTVPFSQWTELSSNVFNASGDFSYTNGIAPGMPVTFYGLSQTP
ncbi:MAG TPA: hypothetical protein VGI03_10705 [Verrucomicrobiae bacterium]|jgi:hypothetical protein